MHASGTCPDPPQMDVYNLHLSAQTTAASRVVMLDGRGEQQGMCTSTSTASVKTHLQLQLHGVCKACNSSVVLQSSHACAGCGGYVPAQDGRPTVCWASTGTNGSCRQALASTRAFASVSWTLFSSRALKLLRSRQHL